jgi:phasin family protein
MLTVENFNGKTILCSAIKSSALNSWLKKQEIANNFEPLKGKGRKLMTNKKAAKSKTKKAAPRRSAALNNNTASIVDIGQFFTNPGNMENFMSQGKSQFDKLANEAGSLGRDGFDAFNKSMGIFTKGFEEFLRTSMAMAQTAAEKQSQLIKEAMSSKSLNEWSEIQNRIAQTNFDDCMAAATKLSEMGVKLLTESTAPINSQLTKGMKKATEAMAA